MPQRRSTTLLALAGMLRGTAPTAIDWEAVIALANQSMTVTQLAAAVTEAPAKYNAPQDALAFLREVSARNLLRNRMLMDQTVEATRELAAQGIAAVLLKGSAFLSQLDAGELGNRMVSDTDILVDPLDLAGSIAALTRIGYTAIDGDGRALAPVTLSRPRDAGTIDLHVRVRGPSPLLATARAADGASQVSYQGAELLVPSATDQIMHLVLHDQFHSRDFWRGRIDLRHLCDMSWLTRHCDIDWDRLQVHFARHHGLTALASQLIQGERLLGMKIPGSLSSRRRARWHYRRTLLQLDYPGLTVPLTLMTITAAPFHRNRDSVSHDLPFSAREAGRLNGLRRFLSGQQPGKL